MWEDNIELYLSIAVSCLFPMCSVRIPQLCFCETYSMLAYSKRERVRPKWSGRAPICQFCLYPSPSSSESRWPDEGLPKKIILIGLSLSQNSLSFGCFMTNRSV